MTMTDQTTLNRYARAAGVAMLLSVIFGALGEMYIPGLFIVRGDAAATAARILADPTLYRLGFAAYYVEGLCDVALCLLFYVLLKPVDQNLALLSAFFGIVSMVMYAVAESCYYAALVILRDPAGLTAFTADQRSALALLSLRLFSTIAGLFLATYGIASMIRGYLMMRSGYFPRAVGALLVLGGAGFVLRTATILVAPSFSSGFMLLPMAVAGIPLTLWLLVRGVKVASVPQ
ncbi:MAG: DUF4386 domain-containing protein [Gemmatimonadota bacterium]